MILKRPYRLLLMMILFVIVLPSLAYAENDAVGLRLDGKEIVSDSPAIIVAGRTLVPARAIFEAMGGTVAWDEALREVTVVLGSSAVKLKIESKTALVDGNPKDMDVAAAIIGGRTMIPVRFVSEAFGCKVDWNNDKRIVSITTPGASPSIPANLIISRISFAESDSDYTVSMTADKTIETYKDFVLTGPDRFVLDIVNGTLSQIEAAVVPNNDTIKALRYSQFDAGTIRIVVDLKKRTPSSVRVSEDQKTLYIIFPKSGGITVDQPGVLPELDVLANDKLVVIDAGHGGKDPGAIGFIDGKAVLFEKDVNLDVAQRVNAFLQKQGVNTYMIRSLDTSVSLLERPAMANALNADLFISIHNNSSDSAAMKSFEVLFFNKETDKNYKIGSRLFANMAQVTLSEELGNAFRMPQERPNLAVLNKTLMPAIITEGAFMSNPSDLAMIMTDDYKNNYAIAAARAVINALNAGVRTNQ